MSRSVPSEQELPIDEGDVKRLVREVLGEDWCLVGRDCELIARVCNISREPPKPPSAGATRLTKQLTKTRNAVQRAEAELSRFASALAELPDTQPRFANHDWALDECQRAISALCAVAPFLTPRRSRGKQPSSRADLAKRLAAHLDQSLRYLPPASEGWDDGDIQQATRLSLGNDGKLTELVAALVRLALEPSKKRGEDREFADRDAIGTALRKQMPKRIRRLP